MSTEGLWYEPEPEPESRSLVRRFLQKPRPVDMICWDGSDEAASLIARHGGARYHIPLGHDGDKLAIWAERAGRYEWLERGDWAVIEPEGGVYRVGAWEHGDLFEASPDAGARGGAEADDAWEAPRGAEGALG